MTFEFNGPSLKLFRAARFAYRIGSPIMDDSEYDILERAIRQAFPDAEELSQVYENDKIDSEELARFGIDPLVIDMYARERLYKVDAKYSETEALLDEKNLSIISMKTDEETYNRFKQVGAGKYCLSPKIDGLFVFTVYEREEPDSDMFRFVSSMSRGVSNSRIDLTSSMSNIIPTRIRYSGTANSIRFNGEAIYDKDALEQTGYVTQRTACQGVLSSTVNAKTELQKYVRYFVHGGFTDEDYLGTLEAGKVAGFNTVPVFDFKFEEDFSQEELMFKLQDVLNKIKTWEVDEKITIDGAVAVAISDATGADIKVTSNKQYKSNVFAVKIGFWNKGFYESEVVDIITDPKDDRVSFKLDIVPVTASNGSKLTKVTDLNLATLIRDDIKIGDKVAFKYMNETTIKYLYKVVEDNDE